MNTISAFDIKVDNVEFHISPLHWYKPISFQVYVMHDGQKRRFHLSLKEEQYVMDDPHNCPADYLKYSEDLSIAILEHFKHG